MPKPFEGQTAFQGAGEFRQFVTVLQPVYNAGGDEVASWAVFAQTYASVEPLIRNRNQLFYQSDREVTIFDVVIKFRFIAGVDTTMTVLQGSAVLPAVSGATVFTVPFTLPAGNVLFQIRDAADIGSLGRELHLVCRAAR